MEVFFVGVVFVGVDGVGEGVYWFWIFGVLLYCDFYFVFGVFVGKVYDVVMNCVFGVVDVFYEVY